MLVIRLTRVGKKNQPAYRVVLTEKSNPVKGKFIEILGSYNPRLKTRALKAERIQYWLSQGAQASPTVHNLLVSENIISGPKVKAWRPKKKGMGAAIKVAGEAAKPAEGELSSPEGASAPADKAETGVNETSVEEKAPEVQAEEPKPEISVEEAKTE